MSNPKAAARALAPLLLLACLAPSAPAWQFTFSIDWKGPTISQADSVTANSITEADILTFGPGAPGFGPLPVPGFALGGSNLGLALYNACSGHVPGDPCGIEVDAISQGLDEFLPLNTPGNQERVWFSMDQYALGLPQAHPGPTVFTEAAVGDVSADVFVLMGPTLGPIAPGAGTGQHVGVFDGDGVASAAPSGRLYPGIGLVEPNPANANIPSDGDNLDALDLSAQPGFPIGGYYISLDAAYGDPLSAVNNSGTAQNNGFVGGDVLHVSAPANVPVVFAAANALGLDVHNGPDTDDLDALILWENGSGFFEPSQVPFDWVSGQTDMLLFSVRRGSAVIGQLDSRFGQPIEAGDVLTTPQPLNQGGLSPYPAIFFSAESLGLRTSRTHGAPRGDDVDGLDLSSFTCFDCNNNGVEDAVDIAAGSSSDDNDNGIPDECEAITEYGQCTAALAPCGNDDPEAGCANSKGVGAHLFFQGTHEVADDDLVLKTDEIPPHHMGIYFMGQGQTSLPFGAGLRCVAGRDDGIFRYAPAAAGPGGRLAMGPGIVALACQRFPADGCIEAGDTWNFQCWYRDQDGACGEDFNTSNGIEVQFAP